MPTISPLLPSSSFAFTAGIIGDPFLDYLCLLVRLRLTDPIRHDSCLTYRIHAATPGLAGIVCALCTIAIHRVFCEIEYALRSCRSVTALAAGGFTSSVSF